MEEEKIPTLKYSKREAISLLQKRKGDNAIHANVYQANLKYNVDIFDNKKTIEHKEFKTQGEAHKFLSDWSKENAKKNKSTYDYTTMQDATVIPATLSITGKLPDDFIKSGEVNTNKVDMKKEDSETRNFTPIISEVKGRKELKEKLGAKKAATYFKQVDRLINPNENEIIEYRTNGVVVKEGDKYIFKPLADMDLKKWRIANFNKSAADVTDQFIKTEKNLHYKFPSYNPVLNLEKYTPPTAFTSVYPKIDEHLFHSEHGYRVPARIDYSDGKIRVIISEHRKDIEVMVRELHEKGYRGIDNIEKESSHLDLQLFDNETDLNNYLLSIRDKFKSSYLTIDELIEKHADKLGMKPVNNKIKLKSLLIHWAEGSTGNYDKFPKEYPTWEAANNAVIPIYKDILEEDIKGTYNKTKFTATFEDGETYDGRLDVSEKYDNPTSGNVFGYHIKDFLENMLKREKVSEGAKKETTEFLEKYDLGIDVSEGHKFASDKFELGTPVTYTYEDGTVVSGEVTMNKEPYKNPSGTMSKPNNIKGISLYKDSNYSGEDRFVVPDWNRVKSFSEAQKEEKVKIGTIVKKQDGKRFIAAKEISEGNFEFHEYGVKNPSALKGQTSLVMARDIERYLSDGFWVIDNNIETEALPLWKKEVSGYKRVKDAIPHVNAIEEALDNGMYEKAVRDGELTALKAAEIIDSAGWIVPEMIQIQAYPDALKVDNTAESFSDCLKRNGINLEKDRHKFEIGTVIKENESGIKYKVVDFGVNNFIMSSFSLFSKETKTVEVPYDMVIDHFIKKSISVDGFHEEEIMEFARVINSIQHCKKMDVLHKENERLRDNNFRKNKTSDLSVGQQVLVNDGNDRGVIKDIQGVDVYVETDKGTAVYTADEVILIKPEEVKPSYISTDTMIDRILSKSENNGLLLSGGYSNSSAGVVAYIKDEIKKLDSGRVLILYGVNAHDIVKYIYNKYFDDLGFDYESKYGIPFMRQVSDAISRTINEIIKPVKEDTTGPDFEILKKVFSSLKSNSKGNYIPSSTNDDKYIIKKAKDAGVKIKIVDRVNDLTDAYDVYVEILPDASKKIAALKVLLSMEKDAERKKQIKAEIKKLS